jgi:hypothetical protein
MRTAALVLASAAMILPGAASGQAGPEELQGAWQIVEVTTSGPNGRVNDSPQPGLLIFADRHYSYTLISGDGPRPEMPADRLPTATELLRVWNPFSANAGTFEIFGDTMTRRPSVAKNPNAMAPGAFNEYTFRLAADTLWTTTARNETGPAGNPTTVRYLRVR